MLKRSFLPALAVSAGLMGASIVPAFAQEAPSGMMMMKREAGAAMLMMSLHGTNLTKDQKTQIRDIAKSVESKTSGLKSQAKDLYKQITAALTTSGSIDRSALNGLVEKLADVKKSIGQEKLEAAIKVHDLLTPDQRKKVQANLEKMHNFHEKMESLRKEMHQSMHSDSE